MLQSRRFTPSLNTLALAMLLSVLLVIHERWPNSALQRFLNQQRFIRDAQHWRQRIKSLRRKP